MFSALHFILKNADSVITNLIFISKEFVLRRLHCILKISLNLSSLTCEDFFFHGEHFARCVAGRKVEIFLVMLNLLSRCGNN